MATLIPDRIRKERTKEVKIAQQNKWRKENLKGFQVWFFKDKDEEILRWIELNRPFMGYVKRLIREDLEKAKIEASRATRRHRR